MARIAVVGSAQDRGLLGEICNAVSLSSPTDVEKDEEEQARMGGLPEWALGPPLLRPALLSSDSAGVSMSADIDAMMSLDEGGSFARVGDTDVGSLTAGSMYFATEVIRQGKATNKVQSRLTPANDSERKKAPNSVPPEPRSEKEHQLAKDELKQKLKSKLESLENGMDVYLTKRETRLVLFSLKDAFPIESVRTSSRRRNDPMLERREMLKCVEFLLLLVDRMEMDCVALCTAIWHFEVCRRAREVLAETALEAVTGGSSDDEYKLMVSLYRIPATTLILPQERVSYQQLANGGGGGGAGGSETKRRNYLIKLLNRQTCNLKMTEMIADSTFCHHSSNQIWQQEQDLQNLLLSVNADGDWRALAIRTAACLFRLRRFDDPTYGGPWSDGNSTATRLKALRRNEARKALYVYAPLAHRMGLHRLKQELEQEGFRLLHQRQYKAVMHLYEQGDGNLYQQGTTTAARSANNHAREGASVGKKHRSWIRNEYTVTQGMKSVLDDLTKRIKMLLQEDADFMSNISSVSVTARVKEPYSLWKKMLNMRQKRAMLDSSYSHDPNCRNGTSDILSIFDVPDAMALRVILKARKLYDGEDDKSTRLRERALCYYVYQLCSEKYPSSSSSSSSITSHPQVHKDYIKHPKPNGYKSLHFRSKMRWRGNNWPFEIQIRSTEMHRVAEYGLAAHWTYKQTNKPIAASSSSHMMKRTKHSSSQLDKSSGAYLKSLELWRRRERSKNTNIHSRTLQRNTGTSSARDSTKDNDHDENTFEHLSSSSLLFGIPENNNHNLERRVRQDRKRAREKRLAPYLEALSTMGTDLAREQVFVFLSCAKKITNMATTSGKGRCNKPITNVVGTIVSLPAGARVMDALREGSKKFRNDEDISSVLLRCWDDNHHHEHNSDNGSSGGHSRLVYKNGLFTNMTERLSSGDSLKVMVFMEQIPADAAAANHGNTNDFYASFSRQEI
eukprot:CAMPEP_0195528766 /NCGR_PEP_ID=MMETSP0794_2-20130614/31053_1 /TAXON_ID=515487 /ORGANISM="Stephanopyxis turris, Strain CCMP 815" /LENGTH=959 /DNA_ID=CAMNT_0040659955 /DNA_START=254 /DNA_END=3133 /DNA_ORIENTATION=-